MEAKEAEVVEDGTFVLPPHLAAVFERTDAQLRESYGASPGATTLARLWLACATTFRLRQEFERAVLGINEPTIQPNADGSYDDDCL